MELETARILEHEVGDGVTWKAQFLREVRKLSLVFLHKKQVSFACPSFSPKDFEPRITGRFVASCESYMYNLTENNYLPPGKGASRNNYFYGSDATDKLQRMFPFLKNNRL